MEERRISTDALADVRAKRHQKVQELRKKGLRIDPKVNYLIEDKELKSLLRGIRSVLKYNSFATLKHSIEELDEVIFNVANVCDEIDEFLTSHDIKPRDINKLNTKERRVSVLYDKLIKWRQYKGIVTCASCAASAISSGKKTPTFSLHYYVLKWPMILSTWVNQQLGGNGTVVDMRCCPPGKRILCFHNPVN